MLFMHTNSHRYVQSIEDKKGIEEGTNMACLICADNNYGWDHCVYVKNM